MFQVKKSSHSRRIARQLKKEHKKEKEEEEKAKKMPGMGDYSAEGLRVSL